MEATASNPLSRLAFSVPGQTARAASLVGRIFGAGLAVAIAFDQSYDPTQAFTLTVAALVLATAVPARGSRGDWLAAIGAGIVFFAGAVLTHLGFGLAMLAMGSVAAAGTFAFAHQEQRDVTLPGLLFVAAVSLTAALQVAVVFLFES